MIPVLQIIIDYVNVTRAFKAGAELTVYQYASRPQCILTFVRKRRYA